MEGGDHTDKLIAYFSASGVTERAARDLASAAGAALYRIEPEKPYTAADLNWTDRMSRSSEEMKDPSARPAIKGARPDLSSYGIIYIGFPIWWGVAPRIINTFIESCDLKGKRIVIFATSGGSPLSHAVMDLARKYPDLHFEEGKLLNGKVASDII